MVSGLSFSHSNVSAPGSSAIQRLLMRLFGSHFFRQARALEAACLHGWRDIHCV